MYKQGRKTTFGGVSKPNIESEVRGKLSEVSEALQRFRFETKDALDCIKQYGIGNALLYLDPPYRFESRVEANGYRCDDFDDKHEEMLMLAKRSKAFIAISGYETELYSDLLKGWRKHCLETFATSGGPGAKRTEILWTNYEPKISLRAFF